jgi:hypothetical protein
MTAENLDKLLKHMAHDMAKAIWMLVDIHAVEKADAKVKAMAQFNT